MTQFEKWFLETQQSRNSDLVNRSEYLGQKITSSVIPFHLDITQSGPLSEGQKNTLHALEIFAARTAISSVAELAKLKEVDHMGGGLDLIPALLMTLAMCDFEKVEYTIENAHASIGYYTSLAAYGYLDPEYVINNFRNGLDIAGHVSWVPGGTQLNGGRLGVMIPVAVGQALGKKAVYGDDAWLVTHCGDAGWISGQALNGFNGADLHNAPITFVMHRNGIQLSGSNKSIMDKDPRPIIESLGISIIEIDSLHNADSLFKAYQEANTMARSGRPSLIYPLGYRSDSKNKIDLKVFSAMYGIESEVRSLAEANNVAMDTEVWIPGALMSYRDVTSMIECVFLVNELAGGKGHHDGHMKGRDAESVLDNPMLQYSSAHKSALAELKNGARKQVITTARPAPGSPNLKIKPDVLAAVKLPEAGTSVSPRAGVEAGYAAVAQSNPDNMFVVSCDLDPSTKLEKARKFLKPEHQFEMSIEEQVSALMTNGLAMSTQRPQLNVFSTFAAFFEGIAREGFEMWRYQRNLNGANEGLNATFHLSHVGACTGRDHFSGWSLDWISLALGYLPYLHRFYAPADASAAFIAVKDLAAHYGGHIIGIPRDNLPVLSRQDGSGPLWNKDEAWTTVTEFRKYKGAKHAILAFGAPAFVAGDAAQDLNESGKPTDVIIVNGLPVKDDFFEQIFNRYNGGIVTIEDGLIGGRDSGWRGFAGLVEAQGTGKNVPLAHVGITDPRVAPSDGHMEVWSHFGITRESLIKAINSL